MNRPAVLVALRGRIAGVYADSVRYHQLDGGPFVVSFDTTAGESLVGTMSDADGSPLAGAKAEAAGVNFLTELVKAVAAAGGGFGVMAHGSRVTLADPKDGPTTALLALEHFGGAGSTLDNLNGMVGRVLVEVHSEGGNMVSLLFQ